VSVCITTYNRKNLLPTTLESVINQTFQDTEILIIDDFSTDGTQHLITNILLQQDKRIKYIRHERNMGLAAARNTAISNASGKFFTFIDDDDQWKPTFVEEFVNLAENYNKEWCFCLLPEINRARIKRKDGKLKDFILKGVTPPVASQFYFTSTLRDLGGYNENIKSGVDHDLWFSLSVKDIKIRFLDKDLAVTNKNFNEPRMTTDFPRRINRINESLKIWKDKIENNYGKEFYIHFYKAYYY
jgi:glycosyltransferase involved in cell wall biosynthesis